MTTNQQVIYKWTLKDAQSGEILEHGSFLFHPDKPSAEEKYLVKKFGFRILKQSYSFVGFFDIYYKPLNFLIALTSVLFLTALFLSLLRIEKQ